MTPVNVDLGKFLNDGKNVLTVVATNNTDKPSPAGFWMNMEIRYGDAFDAKAPTIVGAGNVARLDERPPKEWDTVEFNDEKWPKATALGNASIAPWMLRASCPSDDGDHPAEIRTVFCVSDSLTTTLGRPNREQVVDGASDGGLTTLQALELTNGPILDGMLRCGAERYVKETDSKKMVNDIFVKAFGRAPTPDETQLAAELIGVRRPHERRGGFALDGRESAGVSVDSVKCIPL